VIKGLNCSASSAYFCKGGFYSRLGNRFFAPDDFSEEWSQSYPPSNFAFDLHILYLSASKLPKHATLDGEVSHSPRCPLSQYLTVYQLFTGRGKFQETVSIVRSGASKRWSEVSYYVRDL
jgi:hypothetical protein